MRKIIIFILSSIMVASLIGCNKSEQTSVDDDSVNNKVETKEEFDISKVDLTKENIENLCKDVLGEKLKTVEVTDGNVNITEYQDDIISEKEIVTKSSQHAIDVMRKIFSNSNVNSVKFATLSKFTDAYGNDKDNIAVELTFNKDTAEKINWDNMKLAIYSDCKAIYNICDSGVIHPAIWGELK